MGSDHINRQTFQNLWTDWTISWQCGGGSASRVGSPFFHLQSEAGSIRQPLCYLHHFSTLSHQSRIAKRAAGGSASAIPTGLRTQTIRALCVRRSRLFFLQKKARQNHTENAFLCIKCVKCCHHIHRFGRKNVGSEILQDNMLLKVIW